MACVREVHPSTARVGLIQSVNDEVNTVRVLVRWAVDPWTRFHLDPQLQCIPPHQGSRWSPTWGPFSRLLWPGRPLLGGLACSGVSPTLPRSLQPLPRLRRQGMGQLCKPSTKGGCRVSHSGGRESGGRGSRVT